MNKTLEIQSLSGGYDGKYVLDGVEFSVRPRSIVTLLGPNGCGKSTLLKMIGRILRPESGEIYFNGKNVFSFRTEELARKLAILPQFHHTPGGLTVEELVAFGRFPHRKAGGFSTEHDRSLIRRAIEMTSLKGLRKRPLETLSGGERQRAWIAMTLAQEPELLLLDEPTTFLDICCQFEIIEMIRQLNRQYGVTVIMVLHDLNLAASCSDELIMMKNHKIHCAGKPEDIMTSENLREVFAIESKITLDNNGVPYCITTGSSRNPKRSTPSGTA